MYACMKFGRKVTIILDLPGKATEPVVLSDEGKTVVVHITRLGALNLENVAVPPDDDDDDDDPTRLKNQKLAFMEAAWRRLCRDKATIIQCFTRQYLSRVELARLREERRVLERDMATRIQANARYCVWMEKK